MSSKGKAKRKIDDDDKTGRRNKKPSAVLQFFEDSAREADDSDYDSLDELFGDDEDCDFLEDIFDGNANVNAESQKSVAFCEEDWMKFDMPGMAKQDVKVWVEEKMLVVKAEKKIENGEGEGDKQEEELWPAKAFRKYSFRIALPENIQYEKIKAQVRDGVLYIIVPKASVSSKIFNINVE